jgi:hypothetical protein
VKPTTGGAYAEAPLLFGLFPVLFAKFTKKGPVLGENAEWNGVKELNWKNEM